ncbi:MFS transporter [Congregibacter litoralis]|uniref:Arabinose efflux permease n=1 Tax=Congregibacter litoralis KT71 TaxID=314285 RepID=A4A9K7_9GAMM|nr:MFS transporter [Congregibacter litoralis]EAQ97174.1 Arabinose efflux permease [Congregibacter litoralis KT71]
MSALLTLTSLLLSVAFLLVGHGMQLTLLPLRAAVLGHSDLQIALGGSAYFLGFIAGCLLVPRLIARAGHIRSFAVLASAMTSVLLVLGLNDSWVVWSALRFGIGFFICGLYSVIESWLNDQATEDNRGQVLSVYTFLVLISMALGQQLVNASPVASSTPFMVLAAIVALSTIPVSMTRKLAPAPIESTRTRIRLLLSRSPLAVTGALLSGAVTGAFWTLGAVFARRSLENLADVTLFMSAAIIGGALFQYPFGWLSDRVGRQNTMLLLVLLAAGTSASVALAPSTPLLLIAIFFFGATTMPIYSMALATAADNSLRHEFVEVGTSVLLLNALGAVLAPLALGQLMTIGDPSWLFWGCSGLSLFAGLIVLTQRGHKGKVDDVVPFSAAASDMAPTSFDLDPRAPEDAEGDLAPAEELPSVSDSEDDVEEAESEDISPPDDQAPDHEASHPPVFEGEWLPGDPRDRGSS